MKSVLTISLAAFILLQLFPPLAGRATAQSVNEGSLSDALAKLKSANELRFPLLTESAYQSSGNRALWTDSRNLRAMIRLFEGVQTYGLNPSSYHTEHLRASSAIPAPIASRANQARMDILATDAMIALIAHLHYGQANPRYTTDLIDRNEGRIRPDDVLLSALAANNLEETVRNVQPKHQGYQDLQAYFASSLASLSDSDARLIRINLERWKWLEPLNGALVHINIPAFRLQFTGRDSMEEFKVIIGRPATPTPELNSKIGFFTTSPDWTVPRSIAVKELLPKAIRNPAYLEINNFRIYDKKGNTIEPTVDNLKMVHSNFGAYTLKQSPGCDNALGQIVFNFPNPHSVYVHDTPDRTLFNRTERALSHGCIRVENPEKLVDMLLTEDKSPEKTPAVHQAMAAYKRTRHSFKQAIPLSISYLTCEVKDGKLLIYKDLYSKDAALAKALSERI